MNRTARSLIALASATALAASVAAAAHAAPVDIGDDDLEIPKANTLWASAAWSSYGFTVAEATIFADTIDPADPWAGVEVNDDAFDGALLIWVEENNYGMPDCTGTCTYVVDVTTSGGDTVVQGPVEVLSGLEVSVQQRFYAGGDLARVVATYTNPTAAAITVITGAYSDYGSDQDTVLEGDSSGDGEVGADDHWIITGDGESESDPVVTKAWSTAGASMLPGYAGLADGGEGLGADQSAVAFQLTVQPGQTVNLAYFVKVHGWETAGPSPTASPTAVAFSEPIDALSAELAMAASISADYSAAVAAAVADAAEFNAFGGRLITGLAPGTVVLNWGTVPAAPATPVVADPDFTG